MSDHVADSAVRPDPDKELAAIADYVVDYVINSDEVAEVLADISNSDEVAGFLFVCHAIAFLDAALRSCEGACSGSFTFWMNRLDRVHVLPGRLIRVNGLVIEDFR